MIKNRISHFALFLLVLLVVNSCRYTKEIRQIENKEGCSGILSFIETNWEYNKKKQIYNRSDSFFAKFTITGKYHHCLNGLAKDDVITLLGEPNEKKLLFGYFNDTGCQDDHGHCMGTQIEFNKKGEVEDIELIGWWYGSH